MLGVMVRAIRWRSSKCSLQLRFFFFQAEDGIRDLTVTGVQTCALPICAWILAADERGLTGTFDATGPVEPLALREAVEACCGGTKLIWVDDEFLLEREVDRKSVV